MPNSAASFTFNDFDGDKKTSSFETLDVTIAGGFTTWQTKINALESALVLWGVGRKQRVEHIIINEDNGPGKATSPLAQGRLRLVMEGQDALTGTIYRYFLPMPDLGKANDAGTNPAWIAVGQGQNSLTVANPDHADYATLKTAFENIVATQNENGVTLARAYIEE
jgi:hypothetical protein